MQYYNPTTQCFAPYVSQWLHTQIANESLFPGQSWELHATILYADLHHFSELSAAHAQRPNGAESLQTTLMVFYDTMIAHVAAYGGDIVAIAGDALTIWWPDSTDLEVGRRCGAAMLAALAALPVPAGSFEFNVRIGVATGPIQVSLVGLPMFGVHLALYGPALEAATMAKSQAVPGEMRIALAHEPSIRNNSRAVAVFSPIETHIPPPPPFIAATQDIPVKPHHFLAPFFARRIIGGATFAEYRRCVPVFAAFTIPSSGMALHHLVTRVQMIVFRWGGWLNEVEVGDKGAVFVMIFGSTVVSGDEAHRAVGCCLELQQHGLIMHAGVTVGTLYVGAVGNATRHVYTVQGDEMNVAAHLMQAAYPHNILVSGRIRHEVFGRYGTGTPTFLAVKGHAEPIPVATVLGQGQPTQFRLEERKLPTSEANLPPRLAEVRIPAEPELVRV